MSLKEQRRIPIVVDIDRTALSTVFDSKAYIACLQKTGQDVSNPRLDDAGSSDDEEPQPKKKVTKQKKELTNRKNLKRARDHQDSDNKDAFTNHALDTANQRNPQQLVSRSSTRPSAQTNGQAPRSSY